MRVKNCRSFTQLNLALPEIPIAMWLCSYCPALFISAYSMTDKPFANVYMCLLLLHGMGINAKSDLSASYAEKVSMNLNPFLLHKYTVIKAHMCLYSVVFILLRKS